MRYLLPLFLGFILLGCEQQKKAESLPEAETISVEKIWSRATNGSIGAIFGEITNEGPEDDQLVGVETTVAENAEIHTHALVNGILSMKKIMALPLAAHQSATLKPSGEHIMLINLKSPLEEGDMFPVTLIFEKSGKKEILVPILSATSQGEELEEVQEGAVSSVQSEDGDDSELPSEENASQPQQPAEE